MPSTSGIESIVLKPPQKATSSRPIMKINVPVGPTENMFVSNKIQQFKQLPPAIAPKQTQEATSTCSVRK